MPFIQFSAFRRSSRSASPWLLKMNSLLSLFCTETYGHVDVKVTRKHNNYPA